MRFDDANSIVDIDLSKNGSFLESKGNIVEVHLYSVLFRSLIHNFLASTADILSYLPYDKARYDFCEYFSHTNPTALPFFTKFTTIASTS